MSTKQRLWVVVIVLCGVSLNGCAVKPQQVSSPLPSASATIQTVATQPSLPTLRGLQGIVAGPTLINPGRNVGPLQLGDTRERALELFGQPTEEYAYDENSLGLCKYTEMHWNDIDHDGRWGVFVYLRNNRIYQITADTPRYATTAGITSDSSPKVVRRYYPRLQAHVLLHSGGKVNGGRDLIYWVDQTAGLAFELYYHQKLDKWRVASVIVFEPGVKFLPKGCVELPREWRELKSFTLELLNN